MRAPRCDGLKKGTWSAEEDLKLKTYISKYGIWNWCKMPLYAGLLRSGKSCRLRWVNYLKPNVRLGNFTEEEEKAILHYRSLLGNKWSAIARQLPGRTDNEVKNHWHSHLKKRKTTQDDDVAETKLIETKTSDDDNESSLDQCFSNFSNDQSTSSSMFETSFTSEHAVELETNYNINSPGTIEEVENFWQQFHSSSLYDELELQSLWEDTFSQESWGSYNLYDI